MIAMKSSILILFVGLFLIGNFHVVTDWCDDVSAKDETTLVQSQENHDASSDLCGHCGHAGMNVLLAISQDIVQLEQRKADKPAVEIISLHSNLQPPPTPPPVIFS